MTKKHETFMTKKHELFMLLNYCNRRLPHYYITLKSMIGPAVRFVRIGCHAPMVSVARGSVTG